jgi:general secretion pathway protein D
VNPPFIQPGLIEKKGEQAFGRFIVDAKSTSILMVVRREELSKIRALLKKLDVPKKMVQLDVMLVEKRFQDRRQLGINLLQLGTSSSPKRELALSFSTDPHDVDKGVLSFIFTKPKGKFPATDLTYNFLMGQENIRINANPSILAINQTPATISIVEEISINNGAIESESGQAIQQSYTRAQYGTTIVLTPTIHLPDEDEEGSAGFVSLQTNISFDTTQATFNDRPPVTRRHIENEVRIADGETVILGGLRRKSEEDSREKIPFLGDLPGIGKLFGSTRATDSNTEMFIFITPKIIQDPVGDLRKIREAECVRRPGDVPEFLTLLERAKVAEKEQLFNQSLKSVFDRFGG